MWRRILSSTKTLTLASASAAAKVSPPGRSASSAVRLLHRAPVSASASLLFARSFSVESDESSIKKKVEDIMPIATGPQRAELEAEVQGIDLTDLDNPHGPFGTKEAPAIVKSTFDKRIVGCPGAGGDDEHDVVWFWLEKGKPHICPVCSQYFMLEVVGPGGTPHEYPYDDDDHDHHH